MRRVVIEIPEQDIKQLGDYKAELSRDVKSLEIVHHMKHGTEGSAIICRIRPRDPERVRDFKFRFKRFEVLSEEKDGLVVYLEAEASPMAIEDADAPRVFLNFPFEVRKGRRRVTVVGEAGELERLFRWLGKREVRFKVLSNSDARSSPDSILNDLTMRQRNALITAYLNGYYEIPRKVNIDRLAQRENVNKATFAEHLMKAENHTISWIIEKELKPSDNTRRPA